MTVAFSMGPDRLEGVSAAIDEEVCVALHQRRRCIQSSSHGPLLSKRSASRFTCRYVEIEFLSNGGEKFAVVGRRHLSGLPRFQHPSWSGLEQAGALHEAQNVVLLNEKIEINEAVPAILQVIEVDPEPSASPSIEDIESSGFRIALN